MSTTRKVATWVAGLWHADVPGACARSAFAHLGETPAHRVVDTVSA